jgi:hypothetical protein
MRLTTLLRSAIPAVIVAVVLVSSFVISAGANQGNGSSQRDEHCGYGYTQADKDENGNEQGQNNDTKAHGEDMDKCEDEADGDSQGGAGNGAGDQGGANGLKDRGADRGT